MTIAIAPSPAGRLGHRISAPCFQLDGTELSVAIVLPALNEELTIEATIGSFHDAMPAAMIVVVDNASTDTTRQRAENALASLGTAGLLLTESRPGKGYAVRRALRKVDADIYVMADADSSYPGEQVLDLVRPIVDDRADMVVGNRLEGGRYAGANKRRLHGFGNRLVLGLVNLLFRARLGDIMSGYRALSREFVDGYPMLARGFELEADITLHALDKRFRILEVPINYRDRPEGSVSKLRTFADGRRVLSTIVQLVRYYRPLMFFGVVSGLLALAGLVAAVPAVVDYWKYQYVYHLPLAVLATGLEVSALLFFGIGLILDTVVRLERLSYERDLRTRRPE